MSYTHSQPRLACTGNARPVTGTLPRPHSCSSLPDQAELQQAGCATRRAGCGHQCSSQVSLHGDRNLAGGGSNCFCGGWGVRLGAEPQQWALRARWQPLCCCREGCPSCTGSRGRSCPVVRPTCTICTCTVLRWVCLRSYLRSLVTLMICIWPAAEDLDWNSQQLLNCYG